MNGSIVFARWRQCAPPFNKFLNPPQSTSVTSSRSVQPFLHSSLQRVPILYNGPPIPPSKLLLCMGDLDFHLIHGFVGPPKSTSKTTSWLVQWFCRAHHCDRHTDRLTDHATLCVTIGHIYIRSVVMQPDKNNHNDITVHYRLRHKKSNTLDMLAFSQQW